MGRQQRGLLKLLKMKFKLRSFFKDILLTFITQAVILLAFFLIYRLIAKNFGPEGVGEYSLIKKIVGFLQPLLLLGMGVGIPRYVAMSKNKEEQYSYLRSGLITVTITALFCLIFINLFKEFFSKLFFGDIAYIKLILPLSLFLIGNLIHSLVYSYFRGRLSIKTFNTLQIINMALIPIGALILLKNTTLGGIIIAIGVMKTIIAFLFLSPNNKNLLNKVHKKRQHKESLKKLLKYGLPRVPGDFALGGLLALGPILATHFASIKEAGYLSISQSLLHILGLTVAPLGLILLPKISNLIANNNKEIIRKNLSFLMGAIFQLLTFISLQFIIFADIIIKYWLGSDFADTVTITRIIFLSGTFYIIYLATRSILDASKTKPFNAINIVISLIVFIVLATTLLLFQLFAPIISLAIAIMLSLSCLGILTYITIRKIYIDKEKKDFFYLKTAIIINIFIGIITIYLKPFILNLYYLIPFIILISVTYLLILWLLKMEWIRKLKGEILK